MAAARMEKRSISRRLRGLVAAGLMAWATAGCDDSAGDRPPTQQPADLVLLGGNIVTVDEQLGTVQALAARDGKIIAVGDDAKIRNWVGDPTQVLELNGRLAVPGFIDAHAHFTNLGNALLNVDLTPFDSWEAMVAHLGSIAAERPAGEWIVGRGWHQEKWDRPPSPAVEGYPVHDALSAVTPDHPVLLTHASGHASLANATLMRMAGIDRNTRPPEGGEILRDAQGRPTGVLRENAAELAESVLAAAQAAMTAEQREAQALKAIRLATEECHSKGITSMHDAGSDFATVERLKKAAESGDLGVRLWIMLTEENAALEAGLADHHHRDVADHMLTVGGVKRWLDGALGSHGAWLLEPYSDLPASAGLNTLPVEDLRETARIARDNGLQLCVHAIGDRANRVTLDTFEGAFDTVEALRKRRWRVEHAQHLSRADLPRFASLGAIASMQSVHCTSDGPWVPTRLGRRRSEEGAYLWRDLIDSGAVVINGTDAPVEDVDPIANFHAAVTRQMRNGRTFYQEQVMTRMEALRSTTLDAAYGAFEEEIKGSLKPGKLADIVILSQDILTVPDEQLAQTQVLTTIVGGEVVYSAP